MKLYVSRPASSDGTLGMWLLLGHINASKLHLTQCNIKRLDGPSDVLIAEVTIHNRDVMTSSGRGRQLKRASAPSSMCGQNQGAIRQQPRRETGNSGSHRNTVM
jgi:hypothetical protein